MTHPETSRELAPAAQDDAEPIDDPGYRPDAETLAWVEHARTLRGERGSGDCWQALGLARAMAWTTSGLVERLVDERHIKGRLMRTLKLWRHRKPRPSLSEAEQNRQRNLKRILHPPSPTLTARWWSLVSAVEGLWGRHVSQRKLYRMFDNARLLLEVRQTPRTSPEHGLDRLRARLGPLGVRPSQDRNKAPSQAQLPPTGPVRVRSVRTTRRSALQDQKRTSMRARWIPEATGGGNPQNDSDSGNKHSGGSSDEGGNTNTGQGSAD